MDKPPRIAVTPNGPYRVTGSVAIHDAEGNLLPTGGTTYLCRCGGSRNKPFCDVTHGLKDFDGTESADHGLMAERRERYPTGDDTTVYDDRTRCAHSGRCTDALPQVFRASAEPFVDPAAAPTADVIAVVAGCPSGALTCSSGDDPMPVEVAMPASIRPVADGPYHVRGGIEVTAADGRAYERRERQTLCRCGQSGNKPFCDGSHWYAEFRDPIPPESAVAPPSLFEWAGGLPALERLTERFYNTLLAEPDPILEPVFRGMDPGHPKHVAAWLGETFGGPSTFTDEHGGYEHMVAKHRGLALTEQQRQRWVARMLVTADEVGLPSDPDFRSAFVAYLEWGTRIAVFNSVPGAAVIEHGPVPKWGWGEASPFQPQPWDAPDAAQKGRQRYDAEQRATE